MSFAFRNIILNQSTLSQSGGRLSIGGVPVAFLSEATGGVTGLTVGSGDARYVSLTSTQTISGDKTFAEDGLAVFAGRTHIRCSETLIPSEFGFSILPYEEASSLHFFVPPDYSGGNLVGDAAFTLLPPRVPPYFGLSYAESGNILVSLSNYSGSYAKSYIQLSDDVSLSIGIDYPYASDSPYGLVEPVTKGSLFITNSGSNSGALWVNRNGTDSSWEKLAFVSDAQTALTGYAYPRATNPSGYVTGSVVRPTETGVFYPRTNPSGYVSSEVVRTTGDQTISGTKIFTSLIGSGDAYVYDSLGCLAFYSSSSDRALYRNRGDNTPIKTLSSQFGALYNSVGYSTVDWFNTALYAASGTEKTVDWNAKRLYSQGACVFDWSGASSIAMHREVYANSGIRSTVGGGSLYFNQAESYAMSPDGLSIVNFGIGALQETNLDTLENVNVLKWGSGLCLGINGDYSLNWFNRNLLDTGSQVSVDWSGKRLSGNWTTNTFPTVSGHIANKGYVDSVVGSASGVYTLPFGHDSTSNPADSTTYYFGGCPSAGLQTLSGSVSFVPVPQSGVLRKIIGNANVAGILGTSEVVNLVVYVNSLAVATGSYYMSGRNNTISSGLQSINLSVSELDTIYLSTVAPNWSTNPTTVRQSAVAYISLG